MMIFGFVNNARSEINNLYDLMISIDQFLS